MKFKIQGTGDLSPNAKLPNAVKEASAYLDKVKDGVLLPTPVLTLNLGRTHPGRHNTHPALAGYRVNHPKENVTLWGNKKTIEAFRKSQHGKTNNS